jgi:hypothetical protein
MATAIRTKFQSKIGLNPPGWINDINLGVAYTNPSSIINALNLSNASSSNSYFQVIFEYLQKVEQSRVLGGLFISTLRRGDNMIEIVMSKDMYSSSANGAIMLKFVRAVLAAGDREGKIALPQNTSVGRSDDFKRVIITFNV